MTFRMRVAVAACAVGALGSRPVWAQVDPLSNQPTLQRDVVVRQVLARNPDLEAMQLEARMMGYRAPQVSSLMDPMLSVGVAPLSLPGPHRKGVTVQLEQQLPFFGKRALQADRANAEAEGMAQDAEQMRLRMALEASFMFDDWYVVHRALEVNAHHVALMEEFKRAAQLQYGVGMGTQQDPLQAEVELARMARERLMLEAEQEMVRARLNAMLRRPPDAPLPPPPAELQEIELAVDDVAALREEALAARPELKAVRARLGGSLAMAHLARKSWFPDLAVMAEYSSMWEAPQHQFMAGVMVNLPVQVGMRRAMAQEAAVDAARLRAQEQARIDAIVADVDVALARLAEARRSLKLFRKRLVPAAEDQLAVARVAYEAGKRELMFVIEAEKDLREAQLQRHIAEADVHRRTAELYRALGRLP